jgi:hypothetical protein
VADRRMPNLVMHQMVCVCGVGMDAGVCSNITSFGFLRCAYADTNLVSSVVNHPDVALASSYQPASLIHAALSSAEKRFAHIKCAFSCRRR